MNSRIKHLALLHLLNLQPTIPPSQAHLLAQGARHAYSCTCDTCREFWRLIGPDDDDGNYGPFGPTID